MFEDVINSSLLENITIIIEQAKIELSSFCKLFALELEDKYLFHYVVGDRIFVIANPIVNYTTYYEADGSEREVPIYNMFLVWRASPSASVNDSGVYTFLKSNPCVVILYPQLLKVFDFEGNILEDVLLTLKEQCSFLKTTHNIFNDSRNVSQQSYYPMLNGVL